VVDAHSECHRYEEEWYVQEQHHRVRRVDAYKPEPDESSGALDAE